MLTYQKPYNYHPYILDINIKYNKLKNGWFTKSLAIITLNPGDAPNITSSDTHKHKTLIRQTKKH